MLYDILIIDDDFDTEPNAEDDWSENAHTLLRDLIRENLRVTWTTGKIEDLENLSEKDLSNIQFIFLDLHLVGISHILAIKQEDSIKVINGHIMGIFGKIDSRIESQKVTCYINSEYFGQGYGPEGKKDLENQLKKSFCKMYFLEVVEEKKNNLSETQKNKLIKNNLAVYCKSLIINKAIEVEKIFDKKLQIDKKLRDVITFENKYLVFQSQKLNTSNHPELKKRIQLLREIHNNLAHTKGDLSAIKNSETRKTFSEIINKIDCTKDIDSLMEDITEKHKEPKKQIQFLQQMHNKLAHTEGYLSAIKNSEMQKTFSEIINKTDFTKDDSLVENITEKHKELKELKNRIQLLKEIRNKLAHTEGDLSAISAPDVKKTFWKIISDQKDDKPIKFEDFKSLMKYIDSIEEDIKSIDLIPKCEPE